MGSTKNNSYPPTMTKYLQLASGNRLDILNPLTEQICIEDIAKGLAYNSHFGGQTPHFFSIAEHSLLVVRLLIEDGIEDELILRAALLHDASEAYLGDMLSPVKDLLPEFRKIEDRLQAVINKAYGVDDVGKDWWKPYDLKAQDIEFRCFYKRDLGGILDYMPPATARQNFLSTYVKLV